MAAYDNYSSRKRRLEYLDRVREFCLRGHKSFSKRGEKLRKRLIDDDDFLNRALGSEGDAFRESITQDPSWMSGMENNEAIDFGRDIFEIVRVVQKHKIDKEEIWARYIDGEMLVHGSLNVMTDYKNCGFSKDAAEWSRNPVEMVKKQLNAKDTIYTAFSGASGSGKTDTMIWTLQTLYESEGTGKLAKCLKYYISCNAREELSLGEYVVGVIKKYMNESVRIATSRCYEFDDFASQRRNTWLALILDEVPSRFDHQDYYQLPSQLKKELHFKGVLLLVGSTALSQDVLRQPTKGEQVLNIRMKPVQERRMPQLLMHHLQNLCVQVEDLERLVDQLFEEMPLLSDLLSNHRCARLTAVVIKELLGEIPMGTLPDGWGRGQSAAVLSMVACKYRALNALGNKDISHCRELMLESLALLAAQPLIEADEGVDMNPQDDSLAVLSKKVVEVGLVERAINPDTPIKDKPQKVKVEGIYEFQMSPALTLICISTIVPWIEGIYSAPDYFEALVATMMVIMRYAQTNQFFSIRRLAQAVPYSGSDDHHFYEPNIPIDQKCFINGPQAPYSDLVVAGVSQGHIFPEAASPLAKKLKDISGVIEFPSTPILVQCKLTQQKEAECNFRNEYAKMGFTSPRRGSSSLESPLPQEFGFKEGSTQLKQYQSGQWLTNRWVKEAQKKDVSVAFATSTRFKASADVKDHVCLMEPDADGRYAWQKLYPVIQLVRNEGKFQEIGRNRYDG